MRALAACLLFACATSAPGGEAAGAPLRIVSTAPSTTEILFALGLGERVVGVTRYCDYPEAAKALPKIGGFSDLNLEAILALRPDLVVGERNGTNRPIVEKLEALGIKTAFPPDTTLPEIYQAIKDIGQAAGAPAKGEELAKTLERRLEAIHTATSGASRPKALFVVGWRPIVVAAAGSFADTLLTYAGGENAATESVTAYPTYDLEAILRRAPEVIIDASMEEGGGSDEAVKTRWSGFPDIPAVTAGKVFRAPAAEVLLRPGPRLPEGLAALARQLHPEIALPD